MNQIQSLIPKTTNIKVRDTIIALCEVCNKQFQITKRNLLIAQKRNQQVLYCSQQCYQQKVKSDKRLTLTCKQCGNTIEKHKRLTAKQSNFFCSRSCSAIYSNTHKTHGTRRAKLEAYIEQQLNTIYPTLTIIYNNKEAISSELDIYIPMLKLAFELNGIFHYEPIYGSSTLSKIKNNDNRKFQACLEHDIELCIIDTSSQKRFTELSSSIFLNIITSLINDKISHLE